MQFTLMPQDSINNIDINNQFKEGNDKGAANQDQYFSFTIICGIEDALIIILRGKMFTYLSIVRVAVTTGIVILVPNLMD